MSKSKKRKSSKMMMSDKDMMMDKKKMMMREKDMYAMMPRSPDEMPKRMRKMKGKMRG